MCLKNHLKSIHSTISLISCNSCSFQTKCTSYLKKHIYNRHTEIEDKTVFTCDICQKHFLHKTSYNLHIEIKHRNASKPVSCNICSKEFYNNIELKRHVSVIHEAKDIYQCNLCGSKFKYKHNLETHEKKSLECAQKRIVDVFKDLYES